MTPLRQRFLEDMQIRNLSVNTQRVYGEQVSRFARHFSQCPRHWVPRRSRLPGLLDEREEAGTRTATGGRLCRSLHAPRRDRGGCVGSAPAIAETPGRPRQVAAPSLARRPVGLPAGTTVEVKATPGDPDSGPLMKSVSMPFADRVGRSAATGGERGCRGERVQIEPGRDIVGRTTGVALPLVSTPYGISSHLEEF
jgi:hypothetical protein